MVFCSCGCLELSYGYCFWLRHEVNILLAFGCCSSSILPIRAGSQVVYRAITSAVEHHITIEPSMEQSQLHKYYRENHKYYRAIATLLFQVSRLFKHKAIISSIASWGLFMEVGWKDIQAYRVRPIGMGIQWHFSPPNRFLMNKCV